MLIYSLHRGDNTFVGIVNCHEVWKRWSNIGGISWELLKDHQRHHGNWAQVGGPWFGVAAQWGYGRRPLRKGSEKAGGKSQNDNPTKEKLMENSQRIQRYLQCSGLLVLWFFRKLAADSQDLNLQTASGLYLAHSCDARKLVCHGPRALAET